MAQTKATVCVFCGASEGTSPAHIEAARSLAKYLHENNINLVYGGGTTGLMGEVARSLVALSGPDSVRGIIPLPLLQQEEQSTSEHVVCHNGTKVNIPDPNEYGSTLVVCNMHKRKQEMAQAVIKGGPGSGFIALSGGYGTLEELMEVTTWNQLGIHDKPVVIFNIDGYYDGLLKWIEGAVQAGFIRAGQKDILVEAKSAEEVGEKLKNYVPVQHRFNLDWTAK